MIRLIIGIALLILVVYHWDIIDQAFVRVMRGIGW